jgi:uncharacterized protein YhaN
MRLRRLDLICFGHFSGAQLELGGRPGVVDLVYGSNEAGKSTTLRAISGLLFGIPERTDDAHRHAPTELRIGGILETRAGSRLELIRRKGRKSTLRSPDDAPLEEALLTPFLQGATRELFEGLFGLDHQRLRASAQALLSGKGSVGESLFAAGVGGRGIHELSARLLREGEELFAPRARERKVSKAIGEVKDARQAVRDAATSPLKYLEQQRALAESIQARDGLRARRTELVAEQARLTRFVTVLPGLRRRAELGSRLSALGAVVDLPVDAPDRRARAVRELEDAGRESARAAGRVTELEQRLSGLVVTEALLAVDETVIADLRDRRGRYLSAQLDRPKLESKAIGIEASVEKSLKDIIAGASVPDLHLSIAVTARIRSLAARRQRLDDKLESAQKSLEGARARRSHLAARLAAVAAPEARARVLALLDRAADLDAPTAEAVERFAAEHGAIESERARLAREHERGRALLRGVDHKLDALRRLGQVPTEAELQSGRGLRDAQWRELRSALGGGAQVEPARVEGYEASVAGADAVADRLRREADRVALLSALESERVAALSEVKETEEAREALATRERLFDTAWAALFAKVQVAPRSPAEMRAWVRDLNGLLALDPEIAGFEGEVSRGTSERREWQLVWAEAVSVLRLVGEPTVDEALAVLDAMMQLVRQVEEADGFRRRVEGILRDSTRFAEDVAARCRASLPDAALQEPAVAAERFVRSVEEARANRAERARLDAELVTVRRALVEHVARSRAAEASIAALLSQAGVGSVAALEDAERRSSEARALREQIRAVEDQLGEVGDGVSLDVLEAETVGQDLDQARAKLRDLEAKFEEFGEQMTQAGEEIGSLERGVRSMERTNAADASALLEDRVAVLKRHVERYVRVRLASVILDREIERYRQANQGPIVQRAGELFPRLTVGRYTGLRVGFGTDDEAELLAVRADGKSVAVDALSDGTRDQLYLALRLASLERQARANEPMPLVLDDVLIHFDDDRARAALDVLGDVAKTTQVLFFTHHARLVELAREALGPDRLAEHELPAPG